MDGWDKACAAADRLDLAKAELVKAVAQVLDDMGPNGNCCCRAAHAQLRLAFEFYRTEADAGMMPLELAAEIMRELRTT